MHVNIITLILERMNILGMTKKEGNDYYNCRLYDFELGADSRSVLYFIPFTI